MIFPVYWIVNASFQGNGSATSSSFFPTNPTLAGYETAVARQGGNLLTSLIVALGGAVK